jgi:hypothetical protein
MIRRLLGTAAIGLAALAHAGAAQDAQLDPLSRLDQRYRSQVDAIIDSARQAGLPWDKVRSKALEGINMRVDGSRIVTGVRQYYTNLVRAREVLGPLGSNELDAGGTALAAGIRPEDLALFRPTAAGRSPTHALVYLTDLVSTRRGVPREDAVAAFAKLWKDGAGDSDFELLWRGIDQDILSGVSPKAALQNQVRRIPARSIRPPEDQEIPRS